MANTTNLNLVKPAGTDKALVSVLNSNSDKIDAWAGSTNQALSKLDSNSNITNDVLADALNCTKTTFFKASGNSYTGSSASELRWATFIVNVLQSNKYVIAVNPSGITYVNAYNGSSWSGWKELALNSRFTWTSLGETASSATSPAPPSSAKELLIVGYRTSISAWETVSIVVPLIGSSQNCSIVGKDTTMVVFVTSAGQVAIPNSSGSNITKFTVYYR